MVSRTIRAGNSGIWEAGQLGQEFLGFVKQDKQSSSFWDLGSRTIRAGISGILEARKLGQEFLGFGKQDKQRKNFWDLEAVQTGQEFLGMCFTLSLCSGWN